MLFLRALSNFTTLVFVVSAINLIGHKVTSSPSPSSPDPNPTNQPINDYPSEEEIQKAFKGVDRDDTVLFADLEGRIQGPYKFAENLKKKWILDVFKDNPDGTIFIHRNGRPKEGYQEFAKSYSRIFLQASSGVVWLISRFPKGPRIMWDCSFWWAFEYVCLRDNPNVEAIVLVDETDFTNHRILWPGEDDEPGESKQPDDPKPSNENEKWPLNGGPLERFGAGATTGVSILGAGAGLPMVGGSPLLPGVGIFVPEGNQLQDTKTEQNPGIETDVLNHIIGDLPPAEMPAAEDQQQAMAETEGASDPWPIFQRRTLSLRLRDWQNVKICFDWNNDPNNPDFPSFPIDARIGISSVISSSPPLEADPTIPPSLDSGIGTIKVKQHQRQFPLLSTPDRYNLDIAVVDSKNQLIGIAFESPPEGQAVTVWCPIALFAVYVWPGSLDTDPLQFRLRGKYWDSNDGSNEHGCTMSEWTDGIREASCTFNYLS